MFLLGGNLRLRLGIALLILGLSALGGTPLLAHTDMIWTLGAPAALLMTVVGGGLLVSSLLATDQVTAARTEQRWERVADNATALAIQGRWDQALPEFEKALSMSGPAPRRLKAAERIGGYLIERKRLIEAEPYLREALAQRERQRGPREPDTMGARERLSDLYLEIGQPAAAASVLQAQLDLVAPGGAVLDAESARVASKLAQALQKAGDTVAAESANQKAISAIEVSDPYSPDLVGALVSSSQMAIRVGNYDRADALLKRAMECADRIGSTDGMDLVRTTMVTLYMAQGRYVDAVPLSEKSLARHTAGRATPDPKETAQLHRQHAELLALSNRPDDAAKHLRIAETLERISGLTPAL